MTNDARTMGENNDEPGDELGWREIDGELRRLARAKAGYDAEEVRWLLAGLRARVHVRFGCATFVEYVERLFGYSPRFTSERLRVAEALEDLPAIRTALEAGALSFSSAREVTRVATAATEGEWLEAADGRTAREVERMVSGHQRGERPGDPVDSGARRHVLRFEVSAETMAEFREAEAILAVATATAEGLVEEVQRREIKLGRHLVDRVFHPVVQPFGDDKRIL